MYWNESIECMSREQLREIQSRRLKKIVNYCYHNTPFYRKRFQEMDLSPDDINGIEDLHKLPFTEKTDLRDTYPFGLAAVPMSQIVRIHASSGTTGKPVVVLYTRKDLAMWAEAISRAFTAYGATKEDIFQISYGYGLFTGGLGAHDGATNIGASVIPISSGNTQKQITLMHDFGTTALCCTPSYAMFLGEALKESPWPRSDFKLRFGAFGAEPWTEKMRVKLEETLGIKAYDIYGLSEISGPGVGFECECQNGTHLNEDYFLPEIVDPKTGQPLPEGQMGELCFTHLTKEGMPLLRYRTHDLTALHYDKCECGRTLVRMDRILGRCDDMLIIRGVNVFPSQIEDVILKQEEFEPHFMLEVDRVNNTDTSLLKVEVKEDYFTDNMAQLVALQKKLEGALRSVIGLGFKVKLVEPKGIERSEGKAKRVIDRRVL
ncbi:MAG: phenylacetate--CoA ligase [Prevotella sp.]|nr:phenylacetate--CoA ligase [Prevotella sp.]